MEHQPRRGDDVETWLKRERDKHVDNDGNELPYYWPIDDLLDDYRLHSDTGVPLLSEEPMQ